ncbi:alpha/beta hydrolase [Leisingera sp. ANG-Vp]|uniref:alpha/beta hydrolase n=1 Tax=Leisingera sp. ANG-Vp TaxID=1577896 RepID=UPI00057C9CA8|nr:alpha/beta hydrolase [Leisingera sp. ANG-Vp]KIC20707.1 hypothetical protein RA20_07460 [Leisingera sp. ANG-Vp]
MANLYRKFKTQAELDVQYDVESSVPDFGVYLRHFEEQNAKALATLSPQMKLRYGETRPEYLDFYPAEGEAPPLLVFFHGGYWRMLASEDFAFAALGPVATGFSVANVNYTLCPNVTMDEIVRQCRAAVAWLIRNEDLKFDRRRVIVAGHSAGGHLTAMCLLTNWEEDYGLPNDCLAGGIPVSGLFDLKPFPYTFLQPALQLDMAQILRNSPQFHIRSGLPPVHVTYGAAESTEFHRQSEEFADAWEAAGNSVTRYAQPDKNHFTAMAEFEQAGTPVMEVLRGMV